MYDKYLITGATGFLGRTVVEELVHHDTQVRTLVLHDDPYINLLPKEVHTIVGRATFCPATILHASACRKGRKAEVSPHLSAIGSCKVGGLILRTPKPEGSKATVFHSLSVAVLASNGQFSHAAASERFAYQPRPMEKTLWDMTVWLMVRKEKGEL